MFRSVNNVNNPEFEQNKKPQGILLNGDSSDMSIFGDGFVIDKAFADIFQDYDLDNNGILDANEAETFKTALKNAAGDDNILDDNELTQLFTKAEKTNELTERCSALFKGLLIVAKNGLGNTKITRYDERININSFTEDGSGVDITYNSETNIYIVRIYDKNNGEEKQLKEVIAHTNADLFRKDPDINNIHMNKNATSHVKYQDGRVVEETFVYPGDNWTKAYTEVSKYEYDSNGNVSVKYTTRKEKDTDKTSSTITYYNGTRCEDNDYEQKDRIITKKIETTTVNGKTTQIETEYDTDGTTVIKQSSRIEKDNVVIVEEYSGANLSNRLNHVPNRKIIYDQTGTTPQTVVDNEFDERGVLIKQTVVDFVHNTKNVYKYKSPNGKIEHSNQGGIGDCYYLNTLNAMNTTPVGSKILKNALSKEITTDEQGQKHTTYRINFGGAEQIIKDLTEGIKTLPHEKIYIQTSYTVTEEELTDAELRSGKDFASGDRDVLIHEIAYSKYKKDVAKTVRENNINTGVFSSESRLIAGLDVPRGINTNSENFGDGGMLGLTTYLYTGIKGDAYFNTNYKIPISKVGYDGTISLVENSEQLWDKSLQDDESNAINNRYTNIDNTIDILRQNTKKDGTFKNYAVEVALFVTRQVINGTEVNGGGHAFTLKAIKDDKVILINPWNSGEDVVMNLEDFKKTISMMVFTDLTKGTND